MKSKKNISIQYNKKIKYNYFIIKEFNAGIVLNGYEVKSIRQKNISIEEAFCKIIKNELYIFNMHIKKYESSNSFYKIEENRIRKLLLNRKELNKIEKEMKENNYTIVPIEIYFSENNKCKIKICLVKGKKNYDKREIIKKRDIERKF
jgi:SsrA-binding protein